MSDAAPPLRFGPSGRFLLDAAERRLLVDGQPAVLGARALDLLVVLAAQPGHLLSKGELLDRVWPGLVVEEANLQVQISNLRKVLGGETIATVPGRGYRFTATVVADAAAPRPAPGAALPASRLVGRAADLQRVQALLRRPGCVTLVGTAGVGKTSLARACAAGWAGRSVWVDLAALVQETQIAPALGRALDGDADSLPALRRGLAGEMQLVVLDNAEHLVQACAELIAALQDLPNVHWLVTSQLPLALAGERVLRLEPLALGEAPAAPALGDGALALLVERITAADHRYSPTLAQLPMLHEICVRLDGLPLAIEMAAARVPLLGVQGVHDALAERFALLTRGHRSAALRHRTLHHALEWSYRLLSPDEQALLRALAVFAGGFTLDLMVALAAPDAASRWDLIDRLAALVDRSLVVADSGEPPRYRLLETVRDFGLEQLTLAGERAAARHRHAEALRGLFGHVTPGDAALSAQFLQEMENVRAAWAWAQTEDLALAVELATAASVVATFTVWRHECTQWLQALEPALQSPAGAALPLPVQASWWLQHARGLIQRTEARAAAVARRAVQLARGLDDPRQRVAAAGVWVRAVVQPGAELDEAVAALQAAAAQVPDASPRERLQVQGALSKAALVRGDHAAALEGRLAEIRLAQEAGWHAAMDAAESNVMNMLNALQRHEEARGRGWALLARVDARGGATEGNLPWVLNGLIDACIALGRLDEAAALVPRAQAARQRFGTPVLAPLLALLALAQQRLDVAARLAGHARASYAAQGAHVEDADAHTLAAVENQAAAALGQARCDELVEEGRALDAAAAAELVLGRPS